MKLFTSLASLSVLLLAFGVVHAEEAHSHEHPLPEGFSLEDQFTVEPCTELKHSAGATHFRAFVDNCRGSGRCVLKKNTTATLWIQFGLLLFLFTFSLLLF